MSTNEIGTKRAKLIDLQDSGFSVPPFFAISAQTFESQLAPLLVDAAAFYDANAPASSIQQLACQYMEKEDVLSFLRPTIEKGIKMTGIKVLAIRSSSLMEDSLGSSFAGVFKSYLNVVSIDETMAAVKSIWLSAFDPVVTMVMKQKGLPYSHNRMEVILQEFVDADISGTFITIDPVSGDNQVIVIEYGNAACAMDVSGIFDLKTMHIDKESGSKLRERWSFQLGNVNTNISVSTKWDDLRLTPEQIQRLWGLARKVEKNGGVHSEVEWTLKDDAFSLVQRREATISKPVGRASLREDIETERGRMWQYARNVGFKTGRILSLSLPEGALSSFLDSWEQQIAAELNSEYAFVMSAGHSEHIIVPISEIQKAIGLLANAGICREDGSGNFRIRSVHNPEYSGISKFENGQVVLEIVSGHVRALTRGIIKPSTFVVQDEKILHSSPAIQKEVFHLAGKDNSGTLEFFTKPLGEENKQIPEEIILQVAALTESISARYPLSQVVWGYSKGSCWLYELNNDGIRKKYNPAAEKIRWISDGNTKGEAYFIESKGLQDIAVSKEVSQQWEFDCPEGAIIFCERPYMPLIHLVDKAKGFVFREASLLCHLSVLLREIQSS